MSASLYTEVKSKTISNYNLRCIDGTIHGCGKCVGYCAYEGHIGFLTAKMQAEHQCLEKGCFYHSPKPQEPRRRQDNGEQASTQVLVAAQMASKDLEGIRFIRAGLQTGRECEVYYAAIALYDLSQIAREIQDQTGYIPRMKQIPCDFDTAVALVMSK